MLCGPACVDGRGPAPWVTAEACDGGRASGTRAVLGGRRAGAKWGVACHRPSRV